jgi:predicted phage terminase large subunit-like protein
MNSPDAALPLTIDPVRVRLGDARLACAKARESFWHFRALTNPAMIPCWWQLNVAQHVQRWYADLLVGKRPKLVLQAPPQHGKSEQIRDLICWIAGKHPEFKQIFTSYSDELGTTTNLAVQRKLSSNAYRRVFYRFQLPVMGRRDEDRWRRTTNIIEFPGEAGSLRNTTVAGQITGQTLDVGYIDDPIKGRAEAFSKVVRDRTWNWLTDDFYSRFSKDAGLIFISTRWHVDDPIGRWLERFPDTKVLRYQAVADADDWTVQAGFRENGEALFPEHKPLDFLLERRKLMTEGSWLSEYQQTPIVIGGGIFPIEKMQPIARVDGAAVKKSVRYWDKAGTAKDNAAYSAGVLMHALKDGRYVIEHVVRGQWQALDREKMIKFWAERDRAALRTPYEIGIEQEPGSGGKESAESSLRMLAGFRCYADKVTGAKEVRAEPFAAQVQGGNVSIVAADWNYAFLDECETFPNGRWKDQVDAASGAFARLTGVPTYNLEALAS